MNILGEFRAEDNESKLGSQRDTLHMAIQSEPSVLSTQLERVNQLTSNRSECSVLPLDSRKRSKDGQHSSLNAVLNRIFFSKGTFQVPSQSKAKAESSSGAYQAICKISILGNTIGENEYPMSGSGAKASVQKSVRKLANLVDRGTRVFAQMQGTCSGCAATPTARASIPL